MNKNNLKWLEKEYSISLKLFLISYCGINNHNLLTEKISHDDIKHLFPDLKRVSFDHVTNNIKEVCIGNVILVKDSYNHTVPYLKPLIEEYIEEYDEETEIIDSKEEKIEEIINLENLSLYELSMLGKKYKEENRLTEYRRVCKIIRKNNRESGIQEYHKKKEKIKMKGFEENDKY